MDTANFAFDVANSNPTIPLHLEVYLDDQILSSQAVTDPVTLAYSDIELAEGPHRLKFVMSGKLPEHTVLDTNGNILSDSVLEFFNIKFDDINVDTSLKQTGKYAHDFNGSGNHVIEPFYNTMGCNGTVSLEFTSPVYIWMLEHM